MDRFGLGGLIRQAPLTASKIQRAIASNKEYIPLGIPPKLLVAALSEVLVVEKPKVHLRGIQPGRPQAHTYEKEIYRLLSVIFRDSLGSPEAQRRIDGGLKRLDIKFSNPATHGFFFNIPSKLRAECPYVFFECKNYKADLGNEELDQAAGRLGGRRTKICFVVCRAVQNRKRLLERSRAYFKNETKLIIILDDRDILNLLKKSLSQGSAGVDSFLEAKFDQICLD